MCAPRVEREVELRQEDESSLAGARASDDGQISPRCRELETT
jgi:hypothetical protein